MSVLLDVQNLVKSYGELRAVDGLTFTVEAGEAFGLLGPNGAGKSTTMMMISGLLQPDSGSVALKGQVMNRRCPESRLQLGVVPQDLAIYPDLTARENLNFFAGLYRLTGVNRRKCVESALDQVGLSNRADDLADTFSGGMRRRLNFAAAVMHQPDLLILDEPTVGVDPQSRAHLIACIRNLQQSGTAVIYASHYMEEVEAICARAAIVDHGKLLACDSITNLLKQIPLEVELRINRGSVPPMSAFGDRVVTEHHAEETVLRVRTDMAATEADLNRDVTDILTTLEKHSVGVRSIRTHEPSLERLFLKLTGHKLRD